MMLEVESMELATSSTGWIALMEFFVRRSWWELCLIVAGFAILGMVIAMLYCIKNGVPELTRLLLKRLERNLEKDDWGKNERYK